MILVQSSLTIVKRLTSPASPLVLVLLEMVVEDLPFQAVAKEEDEEVEIQAEVDVV